MYKHSLLLVISALLLGLSSCSSHPVNPLSSVNPRSASGVMYYDVFFEIDPSQGLFRSKQHVTVSSTTIKGKNLSIFIGKALVIENLTLENDAGKQLTIKNWQKVDSYNLDYSWGKIEFSEIEIQIAEQIPTNSRLTVNLDYHLPKEAFQDGLADNIYKLFVSSQGSHAGGPESGAFLTVDGNLEAPFSMTIKHPENFQSAIPGEQVDQEKRAGYVLDTYRADDPYDPSFSCAPYHVMSKETQGLRIEIFMPAHIELSPAMLDTAGQILSLYQEMFGEAPAHSFRIVFLNLNNNKGGGESNGNLIFLGNIQPFLNYEEEEEAKDTFTHLIAHEGYHLWNTWGLKWEGALSEWWVEGGANFMASWVKETLYGNAAGANNRLRDVKSYDEQEAYRYQKSLANLDDHWFENWALVYDYGALVWEQLRQKVGSEALTAGLRDFYEIHRKQTTNTSDFITCLEKHTPVDVAAFLETWTNHNAKIDLVIRDVTVEQLDGHFKVMVDIQVDADQDYELFTALGYKTSPGEDWRLIDQHITKAGPYQINFETDVRPLEIQIDPQYRVPQINPENNLWIERE